MIRKIFTIICFFICFSCSTSKSDKPLLVEKIEPDMEIYQLSNGMFFSDIIHMESDDNYVYISENKLNKIIKANNTDLSVVSTIGRYGRGPGEFQHIRSFDICNDSLFVTSINAEGFAFYYYDKYIKDFQLSDADRVLLMNSLNGRIKVQYHNGYIYYCPATAIEAIYRYNVNTGVNELFAKTDRVDIHDQYGGYIRCDKDYLYLLAANTPNIKVFDYNGNLLKECDMTLDSIFKNNIDRRIKEEKNNPGITMRLLRDVQLKDQKLYCVVFLAVKDDTREKGFRSVPQLFIFDTKDEIKLIRRINFSDLSLLNVCLTDKYLWSFSQNNGCIYRFDRKKYDL